MAGFTGFTPIRFCPARYVVECIFYCQRVFRWGLFYVFMVIPMANESALVSHCGNNSLRTRKEVIKNVVFQP